MPQEIFYQETLTQGTAVIDLPEGGHRGRCYYSGEIAHGLGEGTVRLSFAAMDSQGYEEGPLEHTQILFGDSDTLEESVYVPGIPSFKLGAVLYPDRGTFRIGVRLLENTSCRQLSIAWWASRLEPKTRSLLQMLPGFCALEKTFNSVWRCPNPAELRNGKSGKRAAVPLPRRGFTRPPAYRVSLKSQPG